MKYQITITIILGLALGLIVRKSQIHDSLSHDSAIAQSPLAPPALPEVPVLSWNLHGNLSSTEILALPPGARRTAEFTLWSLNATSSELAHYFDQALADDEGDMYFYYQIMTAWVRRFPHEAHAHTKNTDQESRFWWAFGGIDPQGALALVDHKNIDNLSKVLRGIGNNDSELALSLLAKSPHLNRNDVIGGIAEGLIESDPAAAIKLLSANNHNDWQYLKSWTARDPQGAFSFLLENNYLTSKYRQNTLPDLIPLMMEKDPDFAAAQIAALPTGRLKTSLLAAQALEFAKSDPQKALALAEQHQGTTRIHILASIVRGTTTRNPAEALAHLEKFAPEILSAQSAILLPNDDPFENSSPILNWSQDWATTLLQEDPEAVMRLASSSSKAFINWSQLDSSASLDWLARQPADQNQKQLFQRLVSTLPSTSHHKFESLLALSASINNDENNNSRIIGAWINTAPTAAENYFQSGQGTPAQQELARKILNPE